MHPRLLFRTHYQAEEPAYMEFLIKRCTSPIQTAYDDAVAARLKEEIEKRCRTRFNIVASRYAVDLSKALGLLAPSNTWAEKGHLVNIVAEVDNGEPEEQLSLSPSEKLLHFRLFLEADGAAFVMIARYLEEHRELAHAEAMTGPLVEELFTGIFSSYLSMTSNTADRVALRNQTDQMRRGYAAKTRQHKLHVHMQALYRLGLVERLDNANGIVYRLPAQPTSNRTGLGALLSELPDLPTLEKRIAARKWPQIASKVLGMPGRVLNELAEEQREYVFSLLVRSYEQVVSQGVPICPLLTIIEATQIFALLDRGWLLEHDAIMRSIADEQKKHPRDIRFHVDRRGRPAFVKLSDQWRTSA